MLLKSKLRLFHAYTISTTKYFKIILQGTQGVFAGKILVKMGIFPKKGWKQKKMKPPPSFTWYHVSVFSPHITSPRNTPREPSDCNVSQHPLNREGMPRPFLAVNARLGEWSGEKHAVLSMATFLGTNIMLMEKILHQLRLGVYYTWFTGLYTSQVAVWILPSTVSPINRIPSQKHFLKFSELPKVGYDSSL